jgi:hypothetical protein
VEGEMIMLFLLVFSIVNNKGEYMSSTYRVYPSRQEMAVEISKQPYRDLPGYGFGTVKLEAYKITLNGGNSKIEKIDIPYIEFEGKRLE